MRRILLLYLTIIKDSGIILQYPTNKGGEKYEESI